ncbi:hypothetical protein RCL1_004974 [Eukaryota sp. TZLM3-RCL]
MTYCHNVQHAQLYVIKENGERVVDHRHFRCPYPYCNRIWHRDISAALNQMEIFKAELVGDERPAAFKRNRQILIQNLLVQELEN